MNQAFEGTIQTHEYGDEGQKLDLELFPSWFETPTVTREAIEIDVNEQNDCDKHASEYRSHKTVGLHDVRHDPA